MFCVLRCTGISRTIRCTSVASLTRSKRVGIAFKRSASLSCGLEDTEGQSSIGGVNQILNNIKTKFPAQPSSLNQVVEGTGRHLGLPIKWQLIVGPNGAFIENFTGDKFTSTWGSVGVPEPNCWEMDPNGIVRKLELDDMESCLLTTWIRSGQWLNQKVLSTLQVELVNSAPQSIKAPTQAVMSSGMLTEPIKHPEFEKEDGSSLKDSLKLDTIELLVKLINGKVTVRLQIATSSWLPIAMKQVICGDEETWTFQNWRLEEALNVAYPEQVIHRALSGGQHEYFATRADIYTKPVQFQTPVFTIVPGDCKVDLEKASEIPAWKTPTCHILVKPLINGKETGYMIFDTGASGLVIEKPSADELNLEAFGELFVSGMAGKIPASFRKAESLSLGPLTIQDPVFMEMKMPGLTTGPLGPIIGILGYDVFRRAVIEMRSAEDHPPSPEPVEQPRPNYIVSLYDIEQFDKIPHASNIEWMKLHMITNLPHVEAKFSIDGLQVLEGMFMIDTGAAGASVMFMSKAIDQFGFHDVLQDNSGLFVKGVGGSQSHRLAVKNGTLSWFELGNNKFKDMSFLVFNAAQTDISVYACGILCMNMLDRCRLLIDYARSRVAVIHEGETEHS